MAYFDRARLLERAKRGVKEAYTERDQLLNQVVNSLNELNRISNLLSERLREWYGVYFPELKIADAEKYATLVAIIEDKKELSAAILEESVGKEKAEALEKLAKRSMGTELNADDLKQIRTFAERILSLYAQRVELENYQAKLAKELAPNISHLVEPALAARLVTVAGSLKRLAQLPASTVQVLGAEKALFKHLRQNSKPPKHGVIFQHPYISNAPKKQRGKIARALATNISIAAKADYYSKNFIAPKLKERFEKRVAAIRRSSPA
ncbi:MAG: hypothetical protein ABIH99_04625 [Candidatus Micrarchaeota archaeon]